jgi:hypothetical protein
MNPKHITLVGIVLIGMLFVGFIVMQDREPVAPNDNEHIDNGTNEAADVLAALPRTVTIGDRTVVMDRDTVPQADREEYSQQEAPLPVEAGETPIEYVTRYLEGQLSLEHIVQQPEFFAYTVSFYARNEEGVSAYVRVMNIPDDSVGGGEERFDFSLRNNEWEVDWYGERVFCRRMDEEFWQPANLLCP